MSPASLSLTHPIGPAILPQARSQASDEAPAPPRGEGGDPLTDSRFLTVRHSPLLLVSGKLGARDRERMAEQYLSGETAPCLAERYGISAEERAADLGGVWGRGSEHSNPDGFGAMSGGYEAAIEHLSDR